MYWQIGVPSRDQDKTQILNACMRQDAKGIPQGRVIRAREETRHETARQIIRLNVQNRSRFIIH